jgi:hypothetical protein
VPGGGLEGAQTVQRWQTGRHSRASIYMTLYHHKRYKVSFVGIQKTFDIGGNRLAFGD